MANPFEKIYPFLPLCIQNGAISAFGYYWMKRRFGGVFSLEFSKFKEREFYSVEEWIEYQNRELRGIVLFAYDYVPFYHKKYSEAGFKRADLVAIKLDEIGKLPFLSKDEFRQYDTSSLLSCRKGNRGSFFSSSGSTGTPTKIYFTTGMHQKWSAAFEARIRNWAGVSRMHSRAMIGGRRVVALGVTSRPFYRYNSIEKQVYFSAYHISEKTASDYAKALWRYKPDYMTGYAMSNFFLATYFNELDLQVPRMKAVITSSEKLTPVMREMFHKVYDCKTYDSYSGVEACGLISENEYGQLLISPDVGIMEILNENGEPCKPGETGEIYSTGLLNYDQPLIRYRIGDKVKLAEDQRTKCGRNMIVVDEIIGRSEDVVKGPDGRQMVRFHGLYIDIPSLIAGQLIQHTLDDFTINLQVDHKFNRKDSEKLIRSRLISQLGEVKVRFEYPGKIPLGPNGKFKAVISELNKPL